MIKRRALTPIAAVVAAIVLEFSSAGGLASAAVVCDAFPAPVSIPSTIDGIYVNFVNGSIANGNAGWDFNPYNNNAGLTFFWPADGGAGLLTGGKYAALSAGVPVGPTGTYGLPGQATPAQMADWRVAQAGKYVGLKLENESTSAINYAWAQLTTSATNFGFPATLDGYCYENTGLAINTGDTGTVAATAHVNALHLAPFANTLAGTAVSVEVNGNQVIPSVQFNQGSGSYLDVPPGSTTIDVFAPPGSGGTPAITATTTLAADTDYSVAAIGDITHQPLALLALVDDNSAPSAGNAKVRVVHAAPFASSLPATAVSIRTQDGTVVNGLSSVQYGANSGYFELPAGSYNLKISTPDGATTLIDPAAVTLTAGEIVTLYAVGDGTNQPLGVTAVLGDGTVAVLPLETPPTARVNALHFAPFANTVAGTAVSIDVNGTEVVPSAVFNQDSGYLSTPAVSTTVDVFAPPGSATPAITTTATLAANTDYSIAAIGDVVNQPLALLALVDDNSAPAAGNAKVRVVHASPFANTLSGTAVSVRLQDGTVVNGLSSVQFGENSGYFELPAGSYNLKISTPDGATTLIDPAAVTLTSGEIVTLYAVGDGVNLPLGVTAVLGDGTLVVLPLEGTDTIFADGFEGAPGRAVVAKTGI